MLFLRSSDKILRNRKFSVATPSILVVKRENKWNKH